jgi:putative PIN family toxin of toxin-antitoxin system
MTTLVLDTNVVLDLLVFHDPGVAAIERAIQKADAVCVTDSECRSELVRVLTYPRLNLPDAAQQAALTSYDENTRRISDSVSPYMPRIPRCSDPDDQKFLELAYRCGADMIVTKDRALLDLAHATRAHLRIVPPATACALLELSS